MFRKLVFLLALSFCLIPFAIAQEAPKRDPNAILAIQRAVLAMGGAAVLGQIRDVTAEGEFEEEWKDSTIKCHFVWKNAGKEFRYETTRNGETQVFVSERGSPKVRAQGKTTRLNAHTTRYHLAPHLSARVLLEHIRDEQMAVSWLEPGTIAGRQVVRVLISDTSDFVVERISSQIWSFDALTRLPIQVEYQLPDSADALRTVSVRDELSDFRNVSGVVVPFQIVSHVSGLRPKVFKISSLNFRDLDPNEFKLEP